MYSDIQKNVIDDVCKRIEIENSTDSDVKISFRLEPGDTNIDFVDDSFDITYMFTVDDISSITDELPIDVAIRNIAITCVYFFGNPFPSSIADVIWNIYIDKINHS